MNNMQIVKATKEDKLHAIQIAKSLSQWFSPDGIKSMEQDFLFNSVIVAKEDDIVIGFLCYTTYCGKMLLIWMGVHPQYFRQKIGSQLLQWLVEEAIQLGLYAIEVETLPDEDDYEPYKQTRNFYYENGFKRILYKKASKENWDDQIVLEKTLL